MIGERDKEVHGSSARSGAAGNGAAGGGWKGSQRMKWSEQNETRNSGLRSNGDPRSQKSEIG